MKLQYLFCIASFLFPVSQVSSRANEELCVSNFSELSKNADQLPKVMSQLPINLWLDTSLATAAIKISNIGDKLKLESVVKQMFSSPDIESAYIKLACFKGNDVVVTFSNNSSYKLKVLSDSNVEIRGQSFLKKSSTELVGLVAKKLAPKMETGTVPSTLQESVR